MLEYFKEKKASNLIVDVIEKSINEKENISKDLSGNTDCLKYSNSIFENF